MKRTLALLALWLTTAAQPIGATSTGPDVQRLTMKEALNTALGQNHLIKAAGFSATAASQGVGIATSAYYPAVFFEESFGVSNGPPQTFMMKLDQGRFTTGDFAIDKLNHPSAHHNFKSALTLQQPIYNPSIAPMREMAVKDAEKGTLGLEGAKQGIAFQVFQAYLEAQKSAAHRSAAEQAVAQAREHLRLANVRSEAGVGLKSDELRARTYLAAMESQAINANNNLVLAEMRLAMVVGLATGSRIEPAESFAGFTGTFQAEELIASALENRSDLLQARAELEKTDAAVKLSRSAYLPSVGGFASYQMNAEHAPFGNDNDAWGAGISLNWQIFDGFRRYREHGRATAGRSAAAEALEQARREASYQVRESILRREEAEKRREVARNALLDAEETVRLLSKRFENSLGTMTELLDAQSALDQARANLVESEANHTLSGGQIYYSSGQFLKEMNK